MMQPLPRAEKIGIEIITTAEISNKLSLSPRNFQKNSRDSPKYRTNFHGSKQECPSLKRLDRKTVLSGDPNIENLIAFVIGRPWHVSYE